MLGQQALSLPAQTVSKLGLLLGHKLATSLRALLAEMQETTAWQNLRLLVQHFAVDEKGQCTLITALKDGFVCWFRLNCAGMLRLCGGARGVSGVAHAKR